MEKPERRMVFTALFIVSCSLVVASCAILYYAYSLPYRNFILAEVQRQEKVLADSKLQNVPQLPHQDVPVLQSAQTAILGVSTETTKRTKTAEIRPAFGVSIENDSQLDQAVGNIESELGTTISMVSIYKSFGGDNTTLSQNGLSYLKSNNLTLLLAWEPWDPGKGLNQSEDFLSEIINGSKDRYIENFAEQIQQNAGRVVIRFGHEMNGNWYPWAGRPQQYKEAYRHIVSVFRNLNVKNVSWMWSINATNVPVSPINTSALYYPGDDVVDSIGIDGYNWGSGFNYGGWQNFGNIFSNAYQFVVSSYTKPIMISEVSSSETGGSKADWISGMFKDIPVKFSHISGIVWFNENKETDWRINSSPHSLEAFQNALR